jgi:alkylation response protein AidB-like acyl-CoA dehydrogenase
VDVTFDEAETMLQQTARRLAESMACTSVAEFEAFDRNGAWKSLRSAGLLGIRLPEAAGGGEGSTVHASIVVDALARSLIPVPYLGVAALAGELLLAAGAPTETLERVAAGDLRLAIGLTSDLAELAGESGPSKQVVAFDGADTDGVLVVAEENRLRAMAPAEATVGMDMTRRAVKADLATALDVGPLGGKLDRDRLRRFYARALALVSADLVGVMSAALERAVAFAATRIQFGVPIGTFQAIQHLAAEQLVSLEGSRSLAEYAAWGADELDTDEALEAAHCAKAYCSAAGRTLCESVVQIHGGMGVTWDCMAHLYLKRALVDGVAFGDHASSIGKLADLRQGRAA